MNQSERTTELEHGQAMITAVVFFVLVSTTVMFGIATPVLKQIAAAKVGDLSLQSYYTTEALAEDIVYRLKENMTVSPTESLSIGAYTADATVSDVIEGKEILLEGDARRIVRRQRVLLTTGAGASFFYGLQTGEGGITLTNSSSIIGNVYANGPIYGSGNVVTGTVVSAGEGGIIDGIQADGSMYADNISDSLTKQDAFYKTITNTIVWGTHYPNSPSQPKADMPITDEMVEEWKAAAEAGGVTSCSGTYVISSAAVIGPQKYTCNLEIRRNNTIVLGGHIWVEGNLTVSNGPFIEVDPSLGTQSVALIADNEVNRLTSSKIDLDNSAIFEGADTGSYVLLLSQNNSAELGGSEIAIEAANSLSGDVILYAGHGAISLGNSVELKQVSAYEITTSNSAEVAYESGLANLLFSSGPSGGYDIIDWQETE